MSQTGTSNPSIVVPTGSSPNEQNGMKADGESSLFFVKICTGWLVTV